MRKIGVSMCLLLVCVGVCAKTARFTFFRMETPLQLDHILTGERRLFLPRRERPPGYRWPVSYRARYAVVLYKVSYVSVVPERKGRPIVATGLLAVPIVKDDRSLAVVSYQHGTVYGKHAVPSYAFSRKNPSGYAQYAGAYETRLMVAQYAGQGYVVMAADYFGLGDSRQPEAYSVKGSEQEACMGLYRAVKSFLATKGIRESRLFLAGWSHGGLVTTAFLEKLQARHIAVAATFTAASPNDPFAALSAWMDQKARIDAVRHVTPLALTVFSFQHYYAVPGLARSVIRSRYYTLLKRIYDRDYRSRQARDRIYAAIGGSKTGLLQFLRRRYASPAVLADSTFGRLLARAETYREVFLSPVRMFYGTRDEVVPVALAKLAADYQEAMGSHMIRMIRVRGGNHRGTFLTAVSQSLAWFSALRRRWAPEPLPR